MNVLMAWLSYLSTGWEISTLHAILLKPHSGVFVWVCSHGGCICSFPKQILEMTDKHPPAECWEMGTLCCCHGRCRIERGGESGGREKGGKEMLHFFSQLFPFAFISPSPPHLLLLPFFAPAMQAECFVAAVILTSSQFRWLTSAFFVGPAKIKLGPKYQTPNCFFNSKLIMN